MEDDSGDKKDSTCYNSYWGLSPKERIVKLLEDSDIELTPQQISEKLGLNRSSVRVYLPQLVAQNRILTPYKGAYCSKITHGMRFDGLKVHNIVAVGSADVDLHFEVKEVIGTVKVRVMFGTERQKVSIFISCDAGMDRNACLLAMRRGFDIAKERLGKDLEQIELKTFELNRDYLGVRVDRPTCVTRTGLFDFIERIYQKEDGVRHEFKSVRNTPLAEFEALLQGGVTGYNLTQANFALVQEIKKLVEAQKMTNSQLLQQSSVLEGILKWIYGRNDDGKK